MIWSIMAFFHLINNQQNFLKNVKAFIQTDLICTKLVFIKESGCNFNNFTIAFLLEYLKYVQINY